MPNTAITSALTSLVPSFPASNKPFPPLLVSRCESLLALSRQRASNLKPEEEIARAHACAEIVCTRLRAQLRLPAIKNGAGAPCKPKVYAKLVKFLENALGDAANASGPSTTPRGVKRTGDGNVKDATTPADSGRRKSANPTPRRSDLDAVVDSPSKKRNDTRKFSASAGFAGVVKPGPRNRKKANGAAADDNNDDDGAPAFVMPSIRQLCKMFATPAMAPHVYTGACVVLGLSKTWSPEMEVVDDDDDLKADILSLVLSLYLMVLTRMQEDQMTTTVYTTISNRGAGLFKLGDDGVERVEEWINRLNEEDWCSGQGWWDSVPESVMDFSLEQNSPSDGALEADQDLPTRTMEEMDSALNSKRRDLDHDDPEGILLPGLGTMLHDGIDWTSGDRRLDYREWYESMVEKLRTPAKAGAKRGRGIIAA